ncbi:MAG: T9SS type A sorting domain-containing protein [Bacteroidia bacterium]|nr:T9SS type A sorting domain-containing protein [Bacteroidia bacterium]
MIYAQSEFNELDNSYHYLIDESPSYLNIEDSKTTGEWDLTQVAADRIVHIVSTSVGEFNIPFYGKSQIQNGAITKLVISRLLNSYVTRTAELQNPMTISSIENGTYSTRYSIVLGGDEIVKQKIDELPIRPDSIRIIHNISYTDQYLGIGKVAMPSKSEDCRIYQRAIDFEQAIEVLINPLQWEALNDIDPNNTWNYSQNLIQYIFKSGDYKFPQAIIHEDENAQQLAMLSSSKTLGKLRLRGIPSIRAIPNPVINDVRFELKNLNIGTYRISVKNILGQTELVKTIQYYSPGTFLFDLQGIRKGSYFYILEDEAGNVISTKRLIIIRP